MMATWINSGWPLSYESASIRHNMPLTSYVGNIQSNRSVEIFNINEQRSICFRYLIVITHFIFLVSGLQYSASYNC